MIVKDSYLVAKNNRVIDKFTQAGRLKIEDFDFMSAEELKQVPAGSVFIFDAEVYVNFFYVAFKCVSKGPYYGKFYAFERSPACDFNEAQLGWMLWRFCIVGFNSFNYDLCILELAMKGATCEELKIASDYIIKGNNTRYDFQREYKMKIPNYNQIDLIEVAPLKGSLKLYAGRLHSPMMQDLPFHESTVLTAEQAGIIRPYCCVDLNNTEILFDQLAPEIQLRIEMSEEYGVDLRSKSDAQIAETVICSEIKKLTGEYPTKSKYYPGHVLKYNKPDFIFFQTPMLQNLLEKVCEAEFVLSDGLKPIQPDSLTQVASFQIGKTFYTFGMGGMHSCEKNIAQFASEEIELADNDVESFYPRTILNQRLCPQHIGEVFLTVYEKIVNTRLDAKHQASALKKTDKVAAKRFKKIANSLKIVINGSFGKLGDAYSRIFAPQLMLQVTLTGQLVLLMLIEALELIGIEVVSANTDGIVSKYPKSRREEVRNLIALWEEHTDYKTEETQYDAVYSQSVNSYIALKSGDEGDPEASFLDERLGCKVKGPLSEKGSALNSPLSTNPETLICSDAVLQYIKNGIPVEKTITECKDIRRFTSIRNVKGGAEKDGVYLGKVVRFYYPKAERGYLSYVSSGNKVAKTEAARPLMDLPAEFPDDINYHWYISKAKEMLRDVGALGQVKNETLQFF